MIGADIANLSIGQNKLASIDKFTNKYNPSEYSLGLEEKEPKSIEPKSQKEVANKLGISIDSIKQAKIVKNSGRV